MLLCVPGDPPILVLGVLNARGPARSWCFVHPRQPRQRACDRGPTPFPALFVLSSRLPRQLGRSEEGQKRGWQSFPCQVVDQLRRLRCCRVHAHARADEEEEADKVVEPLIAS
jgi:hypothetical protein